MLDVKALLTKILNALKVDYIVKEGTISTYCKYRHWNSGKAEAWYYRSVTGVTTAVWTSPFYYMDSTAFTNIWNGAFNASPTTVVATPNNSQFVGIIPYSYDKEGINTLRYLSCGAKSNQNVPTSIYAVGTWK